MRVSAIHVRRTIHEPLLNSCRSRQFIASYLARIQHILDEDAVAGCRVIDENVCHSSHQLAVLNYGRA